MIILRNNSHGGIIRVCMGIFTTALRNKIIRQILKKNTSPYFYSVTLVIWPLTLMKRTHFSELSYESWKRRNGQLAKMRDTLGVIEPKYSNVIKNTLLFWVPSIAVTTPHSTMIATRHISNNICVYELRNKPEVDCTHLFTTEKAWIGYILASIT